MHLVISTEKGDIVNIEVDSSEVIENVKAIIEVETSIPLSEQVVFYNGKELTNAQTLVQAQVQENELLFVQRRPPFDPNNPLSNPTAFRDYVRSQPHLIQQVLQNDPELGETILGDDINKLVNILKARDALRKKQQQEQLQKMRMLESDPFNPEAQKLIAEEIRLENVRENMENAIEHIPESFGRVTMLYIDCDVNNTNLKAFVDSGAQQTIMSVECAERCNIMRLIDTRFSGIAKGVGQARILGRVHAAPLKIGKAFFPCSFTILEGQGVDFLLGLDMLKRYQCTLDLHNNVLKIGDESVPFLAEKDIPRSELFDDLSSSSSSDITTSTPNTNPKNNNNNSSSNNSSKLSMTSAQFSDEVVENIMKLGFSKEEVINALRMFNGNPEQAASYLFGGGF